MIERKPDAERIEARLEGLKSASWIGPARQWWPNFVFFFADLPNALRILRDGKLVCRGQAQMAVDTGSEKVGAIKTVGQHRHDREKRQRTAALQKLRHALAFWSAAVLCRFRSDCHSDRRDRQL